MRRSRRWPPKKDGRINGPGFLERAPKSAKAIGERYVKQRKVKSLDGESEIEWKAVNIRGADSYTERTPQERKAANNGPYEDEADLHLCEFTRVSRDGYRYSRIGNHHEEYRSFLDLMKKAMEDETGNQPNASNTEP